MLPCISPARSQFVVSAGPPITHTPHPDPPTLCRISLRPSRCRPAHSPSPSRPSHHGAILAAAYPRFGCSRLSLPAGHLSRIFRRSSHSFVHSPPAFRSPHTAPAQIPPCTWINLRPAAPDPFPHLRSQLIRTT